MRRKQQTCTACGSTRIVQDDGTLGACSFLACPTPMVDWNREHATLNKVEVTPDGEVLFNGKRVVRPRRTPLPALEKLRRSQRRRDWVTVAILVVAFLLGWWLAGGLWITPNHGAAGTRSLPNNAPSRGQSPAFYPRGP